MIEEITGIAKEYLRPDIFRPKTKPAKGKRGYATRRHETASQ